MLECLPVGPCSRVVTEVSANILDSRFELVQPIVQGLQIRLADDDLSRGNLQRVRSAAGLVRPLSMRTAAEQSGPPRPRQRIEGTVTPAAPWCIR
jgi:hypothetical protein